MLEYNFLYPIRKELRNKALDWFPIDSKQAYEENIKNPKYRDLIFAEHAEYFNYEFNNYGFRCDDFVDYSKHKYRILFLGCSHTEGIGLPVEETWAYKLLQRINEELGENIPYWTIAMGGTGLDTQTRALYQLNDMLRPNIIIALFPEVCRREVYNGFHYIKHTDEKYKTKHYDSVFSDERLILYQLGKNLSFLKLLADKYNTKIIANPISSAEIYYKEYIDCFDFYKYETDFSSCKLDNGRDLKHLGKKSNTKFALKVYDEIFPIVKQILHNQ